MRPKYKDSLNPLLVKRSGCFSNHSLREIGSLLLNKFKKRRISNVQQVLIPLNRVIVIEYLKEEILTKNGLRLNPLKSGHCY